MSYDVLKNRLTNGVPFTVEAALERIRALADNLEITQEQAQEQADELAAIAQEHGSTAALSVEERLAALESASLEHDTALMELAMMITGGV